MSAPARVRARRVSDLDPGALAPRARTCEVDPDRVDDTDHLLEVLLDAYSEWAMQRSVGSVDLMGYSDRHGVEKLVTRLFFMAVGADRDPDGDGWDELIGVGDTPSLHPVSLAALQRMLRGRVVWTPPVGAGEIDDTEQVLVEFERATVMPGDVSVRAVLRAVLEINGQSRFDDPRRWGIDLDPPSTSTGARRLHSEPVARHADPVDAVTGGAHPPPTRPMVPDDLFERVRAMAGDMIAGGVRPQAVPLYPALLLSIGRVLQYMLVDRWAAGADDLVPEHLVHRSARTPWNTFGVSAYELFDPVGDADHHLANARVHDLALTRARAGWFADLVDSLPAGGTPAARDD